ncbi:glycoside hydrolase family 16 protein [Streptacidiphilus sp. PAMC 29251]
MRSLRPPPTATGLGLALSGWVALAVTALPAAGFLRVLVVTAFLLLCPGAAAVRMAAAGPGRPGRGLRTLESAVLTVALSLSIGALVAEAFFLGHSFSATRVLAVLAALTTLMALFTDLGPRLRRRSRCRRSRPAAGTAAVAAVRGSRPGGGALRAALAVGLLTATAACAGQGAAPVGPDSVAASVPSVASEAAAPAAPGPWHKVFQDDFNGSALDSSSWTTCYDWNLSGCTNAGNHETEWYLPSQVAVGGGVLSLTADRRSTLGSDGATYPWTSGMVSTGRDSWDGTPRRTFTRGYFAAAVRIPAQGGMFPAFWLMPDTRTTPPELDIAEFIGSTRSVVMTVHWAGPDGRDTSRHRYYGPVDFPAGYHVFALDWESDSLTWYVDGVARFRTTDHVPDVPMEMLLDLAVGYPAAPPASVDSAVMKVDWVQVWQH